MTVSTLHDRALAIAGAAPAFRADPADERELREHLHACADCARRVARMRADLDAIGRVDPAVSARLHDRIREVAVTPRRSGHGLTGLLLVFLLLSLGTMGAALGVGAFQSRPATPSATPRTDAIVWSWDGAEVTAKGFALEAAGERYEAAGTEVLTTTEAGDPLVWTLGVLVGGPGGERRLQLAFATDADSWWIDRITLHDDSAIPANARDVKRLADGVSLAEGPFAVTPLGQAFEGDIDLAAEGVDGRVRLILDDARIRFLPVGGANVGNDAKPPTPGDELACTGILQLSPIEAGVRLTSLGYRVDWRWQWATGPNTGQSEVRDGPPLIGYISGTAPGPAGTIVVFVEDPSNPTLPRAERPAACLVP